MLTICQNQVNNQLRVPDTMMRPVSPPVTVLFTVLLCLLMTPTGYAGPEDRQDRREERGRSDERQERRGERGRSDERQDRRGCRQEEGLAGKDKRDCKQEEVRDGVRGRQQGDHQ
jgi:hypothetical protein